MRFGDYIRDIRQNLKWTQPQAAKEIGIEQSYLSKLESGKSYPSEDVFSSLVKAYALDMAELKDKVFSADLDRLRDITEVRSIILSQGKEARVRVRNWVIAGILALTLGGACLGTSFLSEDKDITLYQYKSDGVTQAGENGTATQVLGDNSADDPVRQQQAQELTNRINETYLSLEEYKGVFFSENISDGRREWRFFGTKNKAVRSPLRWFMIPGMALILGGLGCFFASYRAS